MTQCEEHVPDKFVNIKSLSLCRCAVFRSKLSIKNFYKLASPGKLPQSLNCKLHAMQAMIDFEEDVPDDDVLRLQQQVQQVAEGVQQALATASKGRLLTAGLQVDHIILSF